MHTVSSSSISKKKEEEEAEEEEEEEEENEEEGKGGRKGDVVIIKPLSELSKPPEVCKRCTLEENESPESESCFSNSESSFYRMSMSNV